MILLGATGSIGTSALSLIEASRLDALKDGYVDSEQLEDARRVELISCDTNIKRLNKIIAAFSPRYVCIGKGADKDALIPGHYKLFIGEEGLLEALGLTSSKLALNAINGFGGLAPSIALQRLGKSLLLANKESLVIGGHLLDTSSIFPIDSEHFGLRLLANSYDLAPIKRLILTASGGALRPLLEKNKRLEDISLEDILAHPNWSMGSIITVNSSLMINKLYEILEAYHLFRDRLDIGRTSGTTALDGAFDAIIETTSQVHAIMEFEDGVHLMQASYPDMRHAIGAALAIGHPQRPLASYTSIEFKEIDIRAYPLYTLKRALLESPTLGIALTAASEVIVSAFIAKKLAFYEIAPLIFSVLENLPSIGATPPLDEINHYDALVRSRAYELLHAKKRFG